MITRVTLSATRPTLAPLLMPSALNTLRKTPSPSTSLSKLSASSSFARPIPNAATCLSLPRHWQAVRFHRTDYDGPGHFDKRETGAMLGALPPRDAGDHHDHAHRHQEQEQQPQPAKDDDEKRQLRQLLEARYDRRSGTYSHRGYTVGIGGPVGSGKTALTLALCRALRDRVPIGVVTNDIFTQEDAEFLGRQEALPPSRIVPVETGGCPHAAIREDVSANLGALELLTRRIARERAEGGEKGESAAPPLLLCESGGDNLAANFSSELADYTIYVIDVAGGDKIPRKGGPGITQSDLLVINKIDLAEAVGADLTVMDRDARNMRKGIQGDTSGPTIFASVKNGVGTKDIIEHILQGFEKANELVEIAG